MNLSCRRHLSREVHVIMGPLANYSVILEYDYWTGHFTDVIESLNRSMGQYIAWNNKVKVGITNDPERRWQDHAKTRPRWKRMVVKYRTTSIKKTRDLEWYLTEVYWDYLDNRVAGGGGMIGKGKYQYLYVLLR